MSSIINTINWKWCPKDHSIKYDHNMKMFLSFTVWNIFSKNQAKHTSKAIVKPIFTQFI